MQSDNSQTHVLQSPLFSFANDLAGGSRYMYYDKQLASDRSLL